VKTVPVRDLQKKLKQCIDEAQEDRVVITRRGKPAALLLGVEGKDWETVILETDPIFWKLIQERRKEPTISIKELKARLNRKLGRRHTSTVELAHS
jgi:prevent-host-death family protein